MSRQPVIGGDTGAWATILNDYLSVIANADGSLKVPWINVKDPAYGATGNGSTDDAPALQAAINAAAAASQGTVLVPPGIYKLNSGLTISTAVRLMGYGSGPGGNTTAGNNDSHVTILEHNFNGPTINITGVNGNVLAGVGAGVENLLIRQIAGNGSGQQGAGIKITGAGDNFKSSWNRIRNVTFEPVSGKDDWQYGILIDGSGTSGPGAGQGQRDTWIENVRVGCGTNSVAAIKLDTAGNTFIMNSELNLTNANISISSTTVDANHASSSTYILNVGMNALALDNATQTYVLGCSIATTVTMTSNTVWLSLAGGRMNTAPTMAGTANSVNTIINTTPSWMTSAGFAFPGLGAGTGVVTAGVADSGGSGFKLLRVPN